MAVTTRPRLGLAALTRLPAASRPLLRPGDVPAGIVHIGLGAFHRAHQAVYTEQAVAEAGGNWGIVAVAPRSADVVAALRAQDGLFSVTSTAERATTTRVVGAFAGVRQAAADPDAVVALIADPAIRVITLTVTEKGYRLDPVTGRLIVDPDLAADLGTDRPPVTVPGLLIRGLIARCRAGAGPIAVVSCDNLPANGRRVAELIGQAARRLPPDIGTALVDRETLGDWVPGNVTCPGTMVDRIVPATTAETLAVAERALGFRDLAAVSAEPYQQWVIEDDFPGGRPAWERAGAVLTADAGPWERLKLRTLNGVHSAIAYLGAVAGRATVADALRMPGLREVMCRFIADDVAGSLEPPPGVTVVAYGDSVLERFADPGIAYRTVQVAKDGSQKLPQRVLHTIADRRAAGATPRWAALVVAAWMRYAQGHADDGSTLPLDDPLAPDIRARLAGAPATPAGVVDALLGLSAVFPRDLAADQVVRELLTDWLAALTEHGVEDTLAGAR
jgi:fructuronate reductase